MAILVSLSLINGEAGGEEEAGEGEGGAEVVGDEEEGAAGEGGAAAAGGEEEGEAGEGGAAAAGGEVEGAAVEGGAAEAGGEEEEAEEAGGEVVVGGEGAAVAGGEEEAVGGEGAAAAGGGEGQPSQWVLELKLKCQGSTSYIDAARLDRGRDIGGCSPNEGKNNETTKCTELHKMRQLTIVVETTGGTVPSLLWQVRELELEFASQGMRTRR